MSIRIGNNNRIKNSSIGHKYGFNGEKKGQEEKKKFHENHPVLFSFFISLVVGFIFLFSFWEPLIQWIESFFKRTF